MSQGGDDKHPDSDNDGSKSDEGPSTVVDELEKKYLCDVEVEAGIQLNCLSGLSPCKLASERGLKLLVLNHKCIDRVGDEARFISLGQNVTEADLAWNILSEWTEVGIVWRLPRLRVLNLSHNPLKDGVDENLAVACSLHTLIVNDTNLHVTTLRTLLDKAPVLCELHLSENRLIEDKLEQAEEPLSRSVETLHVNRCEIKNWDTVLQLRRLMPSCNSMFISDNPIKMIAHERNGKDMLGINQLNLNKCMVEEWRSVEALAQISSLRDLRLAHNPVLAQLSDEEKMHLVIARLPLLHILNGSPINDEQREKSERFFIRYYESSEVKPEIYPVLVDRHGHLEQLVKVDLTPRKHANVVALCDETGMRSNLKVHLDHSVCSLMRILEKHTGIPVSRMRLFLTPTATMFTQELRFPNQKLSSLRIEDGDQILIQSKIILSRKKPTVKK